MEPVNNQKSKIEHLLSLIKENPDLEIMPLVDSEIVAGDDCGWWVADWGKARVDHYWYDDERAYAKSEDFDRMVEDKCDLLYGDPDYADLSDDDFRKKIEEMIEGYDWQKVIFVKIVLP